MDEIVSHSSIEELLNHINLEVASALESDEDGGLPHLEFLNWCINVLTDLDEAENLIYSNHVEKGSAVHGFSYSEYDGKLDLYITSYKNSKFSGYLNVTAIGVSFILSLYLAITGLDKNFDYQSASFQWISFGIFEITMAIMLDELTLIMISVVTAISFFIR